MVRMLMMQAMDYNPTGRRFLQVAHAEDRKAVFKPYRTFVSTMGK